MNNSVFNLLFMILFIVIWVFSPWPFETSFNSSKMDYIEMTQMIREGFEPLDLGKANIPDLKNDPIEQGANQRSSSNSNADLKLRYRPRPGSNSAARVTLALMKIYLTVEILIKQSVIRGFGILLKL